MVTDTPSGLESLSKTQKKCFTNCLTTDKSAQTKSCQKDCFYQGTIYIVYFPLLSLFVLII